MLQAAGGRDAFYTKPDIIFERIAMRSKGVIIGLAIAVFAVVLGLMAVSYHNTAVAMDEKVGAAWSQVLNQYKRRSDLIPNLVQTVKGYATHEKEVLTQVTEARAKVGQMQLSPQMLNDPKAFAAFEKSQGELSSALSRLMLVVERYPDLKANQNFLSLQSQLEGTENRIAVARKRFNDAVRAFNTRVRRFPGNIVAGMLGFEAKPYFKAQAGAAEAPKVKF